MIRLNTMFIALTFALMPGALLASADEIVKVHDGVDYVVPKGSPVKYKSVGQYDVVDFDGKYELKGRFFYGYLTDDPSHDATYGELDLYFLPDKDSAAKLPYWKQSGRTVEEIRIINKDVFIKAVIPANTLQKLLRREILSVFGPAEIIVTGYRAGIECDYPTYSVKFESLKPAKPLQVARRLIEQYGC